jgi:hypothetical protein
MGRRKKYVSPIGNKFIRTPYYALDSGRVIEHGEIIKIHGEHGCKFRFLEHVVNSENNVEWIDCFELRQGVVSGWRSFRCDRIKPLPKKRREKKLTSVRTEGE